LLTLLEREIIEMTLDTLVVLVVVVVVVVLGG